MSGRHQPSNGADSAAALRADTIRVDRLLDFLELLDSLSATYGSADDERHWTLKQIRVYVDMVTDQHIDRRLARHIVREYARLSREET